MIRPLVLLLLATAAFWVSGCAYENVMQERRAEGALLQQELEQEHLKKTQAREPPPESDRQRLLPRSHPGKSQARRRTGRSGRIGQLEQSRSAPADSPHPADTSEPGSPSTDQELIRIRPGYLSTSPGGKARR